MMLKITIFLLASLILGYIVFTFFATYKFIKYFIIIEKQFKTFDKASKNKAPLKELVKIHKITEDYIDIRDKWAIATIILINLAPLVLPLTAKIGLILLQKVLID